ncbi:MAG: hypothetical protein H6978_10810 [Gammaproteobacteria bacterium]|nr:hypothetical protein [Gammaproteobacteria bacterium]
MTGAHTVVVWHASQDSLVLIWADERAVAPPPGEWQVAQPSVIPVWSNSAGVQADVLWQSSQVSALGM